MKKVLRMPRFRRRKKKSFRKKRRGGKRRRKKGAAWHQKLITFKGLSFLPDKYQCRMVAYQSTQLEALFPLVQEQVSVINASGVFFGSEDVNGFDIMKSLYMRWRVGFFTVKMTVTNMSVQSINVNTLFRKDNTVLSDPEEIQEQPWSRRMVVNGTNGGRTTRTMRGSINPSRLFGRKIKYDDDGITNGVDSTGPSEIPTLQIYIESNDINSATPTLINLRIDYKVMMWITWYDRKIIPPTV